MLHHIPVESLGLLGLQRIHELLTHISALPVGLFHCVEIGVGARSFEAIRMGSQLRASKLRAKSGGMILRPQILLI